MPEIERIHGCTPKELWERYVVTHTPVIVTDLMTDFPYKSLDAALGGLAAVEYAPVAYGSETSTTEKITVGAWLASRPTGKGARGIMLPGEHVAKGRASNFLDELRTPIDVRARAAMGGVFGFFGAEETTDCHIDTWLTQNLHFHVAGAKEWMLVPPQACWPLAQFHSTFLIRPMALPAAERTALAHKLGGYSFVVQPGEALYFPHLWLHGCVYRDPSFGFVEHFGRDEHSLFLARESFPCGYYHSVLQKLHPASTVKTQYAREFATLYKMFETHRDDAVVDRVRVVGDAMQAMYEQLFPDHPRNVPFVRPLTDADFANQHAAYSKGVPDGAVARLPSDFARTLDLAAIDTFEVARAIDYTVATLEDRRQGWDAVTNLPRFGWPYQ